MNGHKYLSKTLALLTGIVGATALVGLPAAAQVNPNPSIFNEAPYNRSGRISQSTPASGQPTGGSTGTQQVTPTDEPTGGATMEQMQSPAGSTTETTGESDATIQRSTTVDSETQIQRSTTTQPTQTAPATTQTDDQVSPTTGVEEESTGATADEGVQGLW
ncbi:MAG TPA: hypothetical protein V6C63_12410 [Allocoleopsis sp.]